MDNADFLEFSSGELDEIEKLKQELKQGKLKFFFIYLLAKNDLHTVEKIINGQEDFYLGLDGLAILKESLDNIKNSIFRESDLEAIENIKNITEEKYFYIKELFIDSVLTTVKNIEEDFLIEDGLTSPQIQGSPYHVKILKIAQSFLLKNPQYIDKFHDIKLKEFIVLSKMIYLDNKLPAKNVVEKKFKI